MNADLHSKELTLRVNTITTDNALDHVDYIPKNLNSGSDIRTSAGGLDMKIASHDQLSQINEETRNREMGKLSTQNKQVEVDVQRATPDDSKTKDSNVQSQTK